MKRRTFLSTSLGAGAAALAGGAVMAQDAAPARRFKLKYAPHFGMFAHHSGKDLTAQLQFMADQGFRALEDNGMAGRDVAVQERVAAEMTRLEMEMGVFVAHAEFRQPTFALPWNECGERITTEMKRAVEVAQRVNARWCTVVPGTFLTNLEWDYQTANVVDNLKRACEICEPTGLTMVLEPLNPWVNHPGLFLSKIPQAFLLCRAVDHPSCKILDDLYHQQVTEGNLIPNLHRAWSETAYIQVGDHPRRNEPTTGEINYQNVFKELHRVLKFDGIVGMEHGNSQQGKEGELAVIRAYEEVDSF